ncbi:MAG: hypothetical protein LBK68_00130 [Candidatus Margulisbacteria bacterium]|jgi:hypothetical protein|nr:hypothetical protein [Candidatus Margulisiibacteriota bacterium]
MYRNLIAAKESVAVGAQYQPDAPLKRKQWPPKKTLYALREYVNAGNKRRPLKSSGKEFTYTDAGGKKETITHKGFRRKCINFLSHYKKYSEYFQEQHKDVYIDMLNLWNVLENNEWSPEKILYAMREYVNVGNKDKPLQSSDKEFTYTTADGKEETTTHKELYKKYQNFLNNYEKYSKDYQEQCKAEYINMLNLWNSLEDNNGEKWPPEMTLYVLREYIQAGNKNIPLKSSDKEFTYTAADGKEEMLTHKELYRKCINFLRIYKTKNEDEENNKDYLEKHKDTYIDMLNLWNSLEGNTGEMWPPKKTLYVLREYVNEGNIYQPLSIRSSSKEFTYIAADGKEETLTHEELYRKCINFLRSYETKNEDEEKNKDYLEKYKDTYIDMLNLWNSLEGNMEEMWPPTKTLYVLREYVNEGNKNKPLESSNEEFTYPAADGKEEKITHKELRVRCDHIFVDYKKCSEDYQKQYKDTYIDILNLWNSLEGNKGEEWPPEKILYAMREYVNAGNKNKLLYSSNEQFTYTVANGEEETITHKELYRKCSNFLNHYKIKNEDKEKNKDYLEKHKDTYLDMLNLWNTLESNKAGQNTHTGSVYPQANKSRGDDHTGDADNPSGLTPPRKIIENTSPGKRGLAFLRQILNRKADLKDYTNIYDQEKFGASNEKRHDREYIVNNNVTAKDIERGLYVYARYLDIAVNSLTNFDKERNRHNRKYPDPQKINENPQWYALAESADFVLRLTEAKIIAEQERTALLSAYDAACAEVKNVAAQGLAENDPQNWPACVEYLRILDELSQKYLEALLKAWVEVLKSSSAELEKLLIYTGERINTNRLAGASVLTAAERTHRIQFWLGLIQNGTLDSEENYREYYRIYRREQAQYSAGLPMRPRHVVRDNLPARRGRIIRYIRRDLLALGYAAREFHRKITERAELKIIEPKFPNPADQTPVL